MSEGATSPSAAGPWDELRSGPRRAPEHTVAPEEVVAEHLPCDITELLPTLFRIKQQPSRIVSFS